MKNTLLDKYLAIQELLLETRNIILEIDGSLSMIYLDRQIEEISKEIAALKIVYDPENEIRGYKYEEVLCGNREKSN